MSLMSNMSQYDENSNCFEILPNADYPIRLFDWEQKATSAGMGLAMKFIVEAGQYLNHQIHMFYNTEHPNAQTVQISGAAIKQLMIACGEDGNSDLSIEMMERMKTVKIVGSVGLQKSNDPQYPDRNKVTKYHNYAAYMQKKGGATAPTASNQPPSAQPPQPQHGRAMPAGLAPPAAAQQPPAQQPPAAHQPQAVQQPQAAQQPPAQQPPAAHQPPAQQPQAAQQPPAVQQPPAAQQQPVDYGNGFNSGDEIPW